jgi:hypothetical protein
VDDPRDTLPPPSRDEGRTARAYPRDLAKRVRALWPEGSLPLPHALEAVLDTAYHASFLRDEERPVTFRLLLAPPEAVASDSGPPEALLALPFAEPRGFDEHELRRLSQAAKYHRALVAVREEAGLLVTWGVVQSGPRWVTSADGGRAKEPPLPRALVVRVAHPGQVAVSCGSQPVAELRGGALTDFMLDVFASKWLPALFASHRAEYATAHRAKGGTIDDQGVSDVTRFVAQKMVKRIVSTMRSAHHGGTVLMLPPGCTAERYLRTKYAFGDGESRRHFGRLLLTILRAREAAEAEDARTLSATMSDLEEALYEIAHLVAALADVDGAVVLTKRFEILGFGAEISGDLPEVTEVRRALDIEGDAWELERVDRVGTRHRSAYRLCAAIPEAVAVVVSQDTSVRFVTLHRGAVTTWDHGAGDL